MTVTRPGPVTGRAMSTPTPLLVAQAPLDNRANRPSSQLIRLHWLWPVDLVAVVVAALPVAVVVAVAAVVVAARAAPVVVAAAVRHLTVFLYLALRFPQWLSVVVAAVAQPAVAPASVAQAVVAAAVVV